MFISIFSTAQQRHGQKEAQKQTVCLVQEEHGEERPRAEKVFTIHTRTDRQTDHIPASEVKEIAVGENAMMVGRQLAIVMVRGSVTSCVVKAPIIYIENGMKVSSHIYLTTLKDKVLSLPARHAISCFIHCAAGLCGQPGVKFCSGVVQVALGGIWGQIVSKFQCHELPISSEEGDVFQHLRQCDHPKAFLTTTWESCPPSLLYNCYASVPVGLSLSHCSNHSK